MLYKITAITRSSCGRNMFYELVVKEGEDIEDLAMRHYPAITLEQVVEANQGAVAFSPCSCPLRQAIKAPSFRQAYSRGRRQIIRPTRAAARPGRPAGRVAGVDKQTPWTGPRRHPSLPPGSDRFSKLDHTARRSSRCEAKSQCSSGCPV